MPEDLWRLPALDVERVRIRWVIDWYDGPLEALVRLDGCPLAFLSAHRDSAIVGPGPWFWVVHALGAEQAADLEDEHVRAALQDGTSWCFHEDPHGPPLEWPRPCRSWRWPDLPPEIDAPIGWIGGLDVAPAWERDPVRE